MRTITVLVGLLCATSPAIAQTSKVYTNADLSSKPVTWTRTVTPEELQGLQARAFRAPLPPGPSVYVAPWSGEGPRGFAADHNERVMAGLNRSASSYADDLWRDPVTAYAVQHPIDAAYGVNYRSGRDRHQLPGRGQHGFPAADPLTVRSTGTIRPTTPTVTMPAGAGRRVR